MDEKKCSGCKLVKPIEDFYRHCSTSDKFMAKCKHCHKKVVFLREEKLSKNPLWIEKRKKRMKEYRIKKKNERL